MTNNIEIHRAEANIAAYQQAAETLADQLATRGYGEIVFCPGDATAYPFIVLDRGRTVPIVRGEATIEMGPTRSNYLVVLSASFGGAYEWRGQRMHWDYCAAKWTPNNHEGTAHGVAALLNALSPLLPKDDDR